MNRTIEMMGLILKLIAGRLGPYMVIGLAVVLVGALGTAAYQRQAAKRFEAQREVAIVQRNAAQDEVHRLLESIKGKDATINELEAALLDWQTRASASILANAAAGARAEEFQHQLNAARTRIRALSEDDRGKVDCEALLDVDLATVCSGRAAGLRIWSHGYHEREGDTRAHPGGPTD